MHEKSRRDHKIFVEMSLNIGSKSPEQCRSHHQKVIKKYLTIDQTVSMFLSDFERRNSLLKAADPSIQGHEAGPSQALERETHTLFFILNLEDLPTW